MNADKIRSMFGTFASTLRVMGADVDQIVDVGFDFLATLCLVNEADIPKPVERFQKAYEAAKKARSAPKR